MRLTHEAFHAWIEHMNKLLDENEVNISQIIAEWNIMVIVHEQHAKHEDDVIFKEAKTLFPGFTDIADEQHEEHEEMIEKINKLLNKLKGDNNDNKQDINMVITE